ncbi:uncharacterized protein LOC128675389 [Plodia interpunctella]|uniref:uncharacterized protein LOC128675389 n=1 Tax=Plodia interpunctella TaxID=58824 RepID=UPI002368B563|nr:uncharacterized protein LOC128675389 [Plodia interpunctella]
MHHTTWTIFLIFVGLTTILAKEEYDRRVPSRFRVARSESEEKSTDPESRVVYWIPTQCDSMFERGYTCYSCGEAMHCMLGNVGLLALCYGRRPYCNNGVCSDIPSQKCKAEYEQHLLNSTQSTYTAPPVIQAQLSDM